MMVLSTKRMRNPRCTGGKLKPLSVSKPAHNAWSHFSQRRNLLSNATSDMLAQPAALATTEVVRNEQPWATCSNRVRSKLLNDSAPRKRRTPPEVLANPCQSAGNSVRT